MTGTHVAILDYSGPFSIALHGGDIHGFYIRWDKVLLSMACLYKMQIRMSDQLKTSESFEQDIAQKQFTTELSEVKKTW